MNRNHYHHLVAWFVVSLAAMLVSPAIVAQDSASVKITVDIDGVILTFNNDTITVDSYNNQLVKDVWFIVNVTAGEYTFTFSHDLYDTQSRTVTIDSAQIATIDITFIPPTIEPEPATGQIAVHSVPDSATILIDGVTTEGFTPLDLTLSTGMHTVKVVSTQPQWEPLSHTIMVDSAHRSIMSYLLRPAPPPGLTAESLGLVYDVQLPQLDEGRAARLRRQFNSMAETFAIVPLSQGLMAKILLDHDDQGTANALVISGVVLTAASYLLGKTLSARKLRNIRAKNEEIDEYNVLADAHNSGVEQAIIRANQEAHKKYLSDNRNRGQVEITKE